MNKNESIRTTNNTKYFIPQRYNLFMRNPNNKGAFFAIEADNQYLMQIISLASNKKGEISLTPLVPPRLNQSSLFFCFKAFV